MADQSKSGPLLEKIRSLNPLKVLGGLATRIYEQDMAKMEENMVLTVTDTGEFKWHADAEAMIADDSIWCSTTGGNRQLLRVLFTYEKQVETMKKALTWYEKEAGALAQQPVASHDATTWSNVRVLTLDAGKRATEALVALKEIRGTE